MYRTAFVYTVSEKARGACRPGRDELSERKVQKGFFVILFVPNKKYGNNRRKAEKAHEVCRPGRGKLSAKRKVSKGFSFVSGKL